MTGPGALVQALCPKHPDVLEPGEVVTLIVGPASPADPSTLVRRGDTQEVILHGNCVGAIDAAVLDRIAVCAVCDREFLVRPGLPLTIEHNTTRIRHIRGGVIVPQNHLRTAGVDT